MPTDKKSDTRVVVEEIGEEKETKTNEKEKVLTPDTTPSTNESGDAKIKKHETNGNSDDNKTEKDEKLPLIKTGSSPSFNLFWIIFPGIMLLGLLMGGVIAYFNGINKINSNEKPAVVNTTPQPTVLAETTPSPSPASKVDLSKYKITILNGSGTKGEAGKVQGLLEKAGFSIDSTGNADKYDYTKTIIKAKADVDKNFIEELKSTLAKTYMVDDKAQTLSTSSKESVTVIVGSTLAN